MPKTTTYDVDARYITTSIVTPRKTATKSTTWTFGPAILSELQVLWAPGHVALTGVRVTYQGVTLLPWNQPTAFLLGDNERQIYEMGVHILASIVVVTTNNDTYPHTHYLTAKLLDVPLTGDTTTPAALPVSVG